MKLVYLLVVLSFVFGMGMPFKAFSAETAKACVFKDEAVLNTHLEKHVTYPATGKVIKEACQKEMPDEFSKDEHQCIMDKLVDVTTYKNAQEVMAALKK